MMFYCWYIWLVVLLILVMFIVGMVVQFFKIGKDYDYREGKKGYMRRQVIRDLYIILDRYVGQIDRWELIMIDIQKKFMD